MGRKVEGTDVRNVDRALPIEDAHLEEPVRPNWIEPNAPVEPSAITVDPARTPKLRDPRAPSPLSGDTRAHALWRIHEATLVDRPSLMISAEAAPAEYPLGAKMLKEVEPYRGPLLGVAHEPAMLLREMSKWLDRRGRFDEAGFRIAYPKEADLLIDARTRADARPSGIFGPDRETQTAIVRSLTRLEAIDPALVSAVLDGIPQIPKRLPAIDLVRSKVRGKPFEDYVLFGVQHLLSSQAPLFSAFEALGVTADDIHLVGVPYSTSPLMQYVFEKRGYHVSSGWSGNLDDLDGQHRFHASRLLEIDRALDEAIASAKRQGKKVLVLDDGGLVSHVLARKMEADPTMFRFVEQTTRGITEVRRVDLRWPLINVAESDGKELEMPFIARGLVQALFKDLKTLGVRDPHGIELVITGYGRAGSACAKLLRDEGFRVTVVGEDKTEKGRLDLAKAKADGFTVTTDVVAAARRARILIGATGHPSIGMEALRALPPGAIVASISSAEAEIALPELRDRASPVGVVPRDLGSPMLAPSMMHSGSNVRSAWTGTGQEYIFGEEQAPLIGRQRRGRMQELVLDGKSLILLNDGRPLNFDGRLDNIEPEYIQVTRALMLLGALRAVSTDAPGIQPLPPEDQEDLIALMKTLWKKHRPKPIHWEPPRDPPMPAPYVERGDADLRAIQAVIRSWDQFLGGRQEVVPRTEDARRIIGGFAFRGDDGRLRWVNTHRAPPLLVPMLLPNIEGKLSSVRPVGPDLLAIVTRTDDGRLLEHWVRAGPEDGARFSGLATRPLESPTVSLSGKGRLVSTALDGDALSELVVEDGRSDVRRKMLPAAAQGASAFDLALSPDLIAVQAVKEKPAFFLHPLGKDETIAIAAPSGLRRIDRLLGSDLGRRMLALGKDADGRTSATILDVAGRRIERIAHLPNDAELKYASFDAARNGWSIGYRPSGAPDEMAFFEETTIA
jgi:hypothetical protein